MAIRPRHARKEVRQFADWLDDNGWQYNGDDTKGHTLWRWPPTGDILKLPETPNGHGWVARTRSNALAAMGHNAGNKRDATAARERQARRRDAERAQAARTKAEADRIGAENERRRRLIAAYNNHRFYATLMQPGR
jgi:hypothetical protein